MKSHEINKIKQNIYNCNNIAFLRQKVIELWGIIDNIDTLSDMCKGDTESYYKQVHEQQLKRWHIGIKSDGYSLYTEHEEK